MSTLTGWTSLPARVASVESFLFRNSFLLLASLLLVEGLFFFASPLAFAAGDSWLQLPMEKLKVEPMVTVRVKAWPWLASVWQRSRHLEAREFSLSIAVIFNSDLN